MIFCEKKLEHFNNIHHRTDHGEERVIEQIGIVKIKMVAMKG